LLAHIFLPSSRTTMVMSAVGLASSAAISAGQFSAQGPLHIDLPPASLSKVYSVIPLASTKVLPFGVSAVFSICADAADAATMKARAAIVANVLEEFLDIAIYSHSIKCRRGCVIRQTPPAETYSVCVPFDWTSASPQLSFRNRA